jgi:hypothetical protein
MKYYNSDNGSVMVRRNFLEHKDVMGPWRFHALLFILLIADSESGWVEIDGQDLADHLEFERVLGLTKKAALDKGTKILRWLIEKGYLRVVKNPASKGSARTFEVAEYLITEGDLEGKYTQSREIRS